MLPLEVKPVCDSVFSSVKHREEHLSHRFVVKRKQDHICKTPKTVNDMYTRLFSFTSPFHSPQPTESDPFTTQENSYLSSSNHFLLLSTMLLDSTLPLPYPCPLLGSLQEGFFPCNSTESALSKVTNDF